MTQPWPLSRKVLLFAPFVSPKHSAPNLYQLFSRIDPRHYAVLTTTEGIAEGVALGNPWLAGPYRFCDDPVATRETMALSRSPALPRRSRRRGLATRLRVRWLVRWLHDNVILFTRTASFVRGGLRAAAETRCELLLATSDSGPALIAAWLVARLTRTPYAYHLFDLYRGNRLPGCWPGLARLLEGRMFTGAEFLVAPNAATADYYRRRYGDRVRLEIVAPVLGGDLPAAEPPPYDPKPPFTICYTGAVYWAQWDALANCIRAMDLLTDVPVQLRIYCPTPPPELTRLASGRANVWLGAGRPSEIPVIQREATLLLLPLSWHPDGVDIVATATPGRSVEYLASGRVMLIHAPEYAQVCRDARTHGLGVVSDRNDPAALARDIRAFLGAPEVGRDYVRNARETFRRRHDPAVVVERLRSVLDGRYRRGPQRS